MSTVSPHKYDNHYRNECRGIRWISCGAPDTGEAEYAWDPTKNRLVMINWEYLGVSRNAYVGIHRNPKGIRSVVDDPNREQNWHIISEANIEWLKG